MKYLKYMLSVLVVAVVVGDLSAFAAGKPALENEVKKVQEALPSKPTARPLKSRRILIFDKCEGYAHGCIPLASKTFEMMGEKSGAYKSVTLSDMSAFEADNLAKFDAVLFNNNTRLAFNNPAHRKALLDFVKSGKGIIGIHAASDNFYNWPEAAEMIGGQFDGHPWRANGTWVVKLDDPTHPINKGFGGKGFSINDEIYQIKGAYSRDTHRVLLSLDMTQEVNRKVKGIKRKDNDFAIAWVKSCGKGRVFYSSLGHNHAVYWNPAVLQHYLDGIQYALGDLEADDSPSGKIAEKTNYDAILSYEFGGNKTALGEITKSIKGADSERLAEIESELINILDNPTATSACKKFVCRMLRRCGTERSIPSLAVLLVDKDLSHMARFALQGIDSSKVDAALRVALSQVDSQLALGIIGSLGQRRDALAVPALAKLLSGDDQSLAEASAISLGNIGTLAAVKALSASLASGYKIPVTDALLTAAERLVASGNTLESVSIYNKLYASDQAEWVQVASLRGLVLVEGVKVLPRIVAILNGDNGGLKKQAVALMTELPPGLDVTKSIGGLLPSLTPSVQAVLLGVLIERGDSVAISTIAAYAKSDNSEIKGVALRGLGVLNDDKSLPLLLGALSDSGKISAIAAESLCRMSNSSIDGMLISELNKSDDTTARCNIIEVLATRSAKAALPSFVNALKDSDAKVSKATVKALGALGGDAEVVPILDILITTDDTRQRLNAEKAISMIAMQSKNSDAITRPVADALQSANKDVAASLVAILKRAGGSVSLVALQNELKSVDVNRRKGAVRALASWGDLSPAESLLQVALSETDESIKMLALRGYIGFARKASGRKGVEMCQKALNVVTRPEDKKIILGILGSLPHTSTLELVEPFLGTAEFRAEAEVAYSAIANAITATDVMAAHVALNKVATFQNEALAENARNALSKLKAAIII